MPDGLLLSAQRKVKPLHDDAFLSQDESDGGFSSRVSFVRGFSRKDSLKVAARIRSIARSDFYLEYMNAIVLYEESIGDFIINYSPSFLQKKLLSSKRSRDVYDLFDIYSRGFVTKPEIKIVLKLLRERAIQLNSSDLLKNVGLLERKLDEIFTSSRELMEFYRLLADVTGTPVYDFDKFFSLALSIENVRFSKAG